MKTSSNFRNELGNEISVTMEDKPIDGVPGILLTMTGPNSTLESHATKEEMRVWFLHLSKWFK